MFLHMTKSQKENYFVLFSCDKLMKILTLPFFNVNINPRPCHGPLFRFLKANMSPDDAEVIKTIL